MVFPSTGFIPAETVEAHRVREGTVMQPLKGSQELMGHKGPPGPSG
jgi:hypothetical protein